MPVEKTDNNDSIYNDIDEVLAAPPSKLVRYGNTIFLLVLLIVFAVLYFVKYTAGINCRAVFTNLHATEVNAPKNESIIKKAFVAEGSVVKKGDCLLILQTIEAEKLDTIKATIAGKIILKRNLIIDDIVEPHRNLLLINGLEPRITVKLILEENTDKLLIKIRQQVDINMPKNGQTVNATITSLPYQINEKGSFMVDAYLPTKLNSTDIELISANLNTGTAFIGIEKRRLFGKLF